MPAIATTLIGVLTGDWLRSYREKRDHALGLFFFGNLLAVAGLWWNHEFPINKKIWTSSYVLFASGVAMELLAMCYWLIDVRGRCKWGLAFLVLGTNAITVFFASGIFGRLLRFIEITPQGPRWMPPRSAGGTPLSTWLYRAVFQAHIHDPYAASAAWAAAYLLFWLIVMLPLYRHRVFIKI